MACTTLGNGTVRDGIWSSGTAFAEHTIRVEDVHATVRKGHRLRLDVTSSSFPRLERNLNTGGRNFDETAMVVATNRVHHGAEIVEKLNAEVARIVALPDVQSQFATQGVDPAPTTPEQFAGLRRAMAGVTSAGGTAASAVGATSSCPAPSSTSRSPQLAASSTS